MDNKHPGPLANVEEPSVTREPNTDPESSWPEPGPNWKQAFKTWGAAWETHIYVFAVCFFVVFAYALYYVVVNIKDGLQNKYLSVSLNFMMVVCGLSRLLVLTIDPYHQGTAVKALPTELTRILWSLAAPSLTSADCLCILSLLETYQIPIGAKVFQKPSTIFPIIGAHFGFVFISDLVVSAHVKAKGMLLFCQVLFIIWCGFLGIGYLIIGYKLDKLIFIHPGSLNECKEIQQEGRWYIYVIYASGILNIISSCIYIYSAAGVFGVYSDATYVDSWSWWSLQTALRVTELVAAVLIFTVSAKRTLPQAHESELPTGEKRSSFQAHLVSQDGIALEMVGNEGTVENKSLRHKESMITTLGKKVKEARNADSIPVGYS